MYIFLTIFFIFFTLIAWRNLPNAFAILTALLPAYLIRFNIFGLPSTLLEGMILTITAVWFIKFGFQKIKKRYNGKLPYKPFPFQNQIILIMAAATVSVFVAPDFYKALGLWRAYFLEPILFFLIFIQIVRNPKDFKKILYALGVSALGVALFSIYQKITGQFMPAPFLQPDAPKRITSFYTSPNAVGLFLAPIIMIYFGWLLEKGKKILVSFWQIAVITLSLLAVFFTVSEGTWAGLIIALLFFTAIISFKKYSANIFILLSMKVFAGIIILGGIIFSAVNYPLMEAKTARIIQSPSAQNRLTLWQGSWNFLTDNPKNFIFGAGIFGFPKIQNQFRDPLKLEPLIYPHNIFLNFWMDIGLLGMIGFVWLIISFLKKTSQTIITDKSFAPAALLGAMLTILIHGFIDVPYFKNDLAFLFWLIPGLFTIYNNEKIIQQYSPKD